MSQRIEYQQASPELFRQFLAFSRATEATVIDEHTRELVKIRASQLNGCDFCLDLHVKRAKIQGERELRLYHVPIWRESQLFSSRERAALEWTEALTHLPAEGVPDAVFERVRAEFSEHELTELTFVIMAINAWNLVNVAFRTVPGSADEAFGLAKAQLT